MDELGESHEELERKIERTIGRMADAMERSSSSLTVSLKELKQEIADLKESRFKPYFTSVGLFVIITLAVTGYVYNLESRITSALFTLQKSISSNDADIRVNKELIAIHAERALARQDHAKEREYALIERIERNRENAVSIAQEVVKHLRNHPADVDSDPGT